MTAYQIEPATANWKHPVVRTRQNGVRPDVQWRRRGVSAARPELSNHKLLRAVEWIHGRRGRPWTWTEGQTMKELDQRAWTWTELQWFTKVPTQPWLIELFPKLGARRAGYMLFVCWLIEAYRRGAVGIQLSYEEAMVMFGVKSRRTWRKWTDEMEKDGLIRIVNTWRSREGCDGVGTTGRTRLLTRNLYRIGPALEEHGPALLEGRNDGDVDPKICTRSARALRHKTRAARREHKAVCWQSSRKVCASSQATPGRPGRPSAGGEFVRGSSSPPTIPGKLHSNSPGEVEYSRPEGTDYKGAELAASRLATNPATQPAAIEPFPPPELEPRTNSPPADGRPGRPGVACELAHTFRGPNTGAEPIVQWLKRHGDTLETGPDERAQKRNE